MRARIFIDYWNFTIEWNKRTNNSPCDWRLLPSVVCRAAGKELDAAGLGGQLQLEETGVYASYEPGREAKLKVWLNDFLDRQPGIRVFPRERKWREKPVHCRACRVETALCPSCGQPFGRASEKAVDAWIVTDMMSLAWQNAYEVALLLSSDGDFIPAVENLQARNFKVLNLTWDGIGHELAKVCWASILLDKLRPDLLRKR